MFSLFSSPSSFIVYWVSKKFDDIDQSSEFVLCIFCFSDWFMIYLLFHPSGSSTSNCHFRISSSGFQTFHSLLLHLNLLACWEKSLRLPLLISSLLSRMEFLLWKSFNTSFCRRSMFVPKNIILINYTGEFYCVGASQKKKNSCVTKICLPVFLPHTCDVLSRMLYFRPLTLLASLVLVFFVS